MLLFFSTNQRAWRSSLQRLATKRPVRSLLRTNRKGALFCRCGERLQLFGLSGGAGRKKSDGNMSVLLRPRRRASEQEGWGLELKNIGALKHQNEGPLTFNRGHSSLLNIKPAWPPGPVAIDSALLFTSVIKTQMALTYSMSRGGGGFTLVLCSWRRASGISSALVLSCPSPSPRAGLQTGGQATPLRRAGLRAPGSPSRITPPTVQYLKKSSILFVLKKNPSICWHRLRLPLTNLYAECKTVERFKGGGVTN